MVQKSYNGLKQLWFLSNRPEAIATLVKRMEHDALVVARAFYMGVL